MAHQGTPDRELDSNELRDAAVSGVRWFAAAKVASEVLQLVAAVALARLISPADFGNAAVAMILLPLAVILTYEGFGSALVQRKLITDGHYEAATLTSVASGFALSLITFLLAPIVAAPIFGAEIADLIQLVSPAFALAGIGAVSRAHLLRQLDFRTSSLIETSSLVLGSFAAVGLAAAGLGAEALVLGGLITTAIASLLLIVAAPRHGRAGARRSWRRSAASALPPPPPASSTWRSATSTTPSSPRASARRRSASTGVPSSSASSIRTSSAA